MAAEQGLGQPRLLARFVGNPREDMPQGLPFHLKEYLELVGRSCASFARGISESLHVIERAGLSEQIRKGLFQQTFRPF